VTTLPGWVVDTSLMNYQAMLKVDIK